MTESTHDQPPPLGPPPGPDRGWNTDHLKDYRALRRSRHDRKVAGVAGGLGRHLDIDPTILRVLFVVLVFFGGAGLLLYGALWLLVPEEQTGSSVVGTSDSTRNALVIAVLVLAGLVAVSDSWNGYGFPWALAVAAIVFFAVMLTRDRRTRPGTRPPGTPDPWTPASGGAAYGPSAPSAPSAGGIPQSDPSAEDFTPTGPAPAPGSAAPPPPGGYGTEGTGWYPPAPAQPDPRRTGPLLFGFTLALVALALGVLGLYDAAGGDVTDAAYPALALTVVGAMLLLGAFVGRAGGLILLGLIAALALGGAAVANPSYDGDRDLLVRPTTAAQLQDSYEVPAGRIELDLTRVQDPAELDGRSIAVEANVGEISVIVPDGVNVRYDAQVDAGGGIDVPGQSREGWDNSLSGVLTSSAPTEATVDLDLDLRFGHIELEQR